MEPTIHCVFLAYFGPKKYRGSPTSTVFTSMNSTSTNFSAIGMKFILVEFLISKFVLVEFSLCTTQLVQFRIVRFFPGPKNRTKWGPPVHVKAKNVQFSCFLVRTLQCT